VDSSGLKIPFLSFSSAQTSGSYVLVGSDIVDIFSSSALLLTVFARSLYKNNSLYSPRVFCFTFFILSMTVILYYVIVAIHKKSATDYLTKLGNKRSFSHTVEALFRDAQHSNRAFALLMIDVNRFKQINDTFGHPAGDAVLKHIAGALAVAMESPRGCFRYGGDEFAILLANASPFAVELSRAAIHEEIEALTIDELHGYRVSVSIGMAMWEKGKTLQDLIDEADQDLYEQKKLRS
jgi:diguanylate cyclase (GGDEF)-like protein